MCIMCTPYLILGGGTICDRGAGEEGEGEEEEEEGEVKNVYFRLDCFKFFAILFAESIG